MIHLLAAAAAAAIANSPPDTAADARRLLLTCEKRFLHLHSIEGTMRRAAARGDEKAETETDFAYRDDDHAFFENAYPVPHSVYWDGATLTVWSPQENAVVQEPASHLSMAERAVFGVEPGYGLDPLGPIALDRYVGDVKDGEGGAKVVTLTPVDKRDPRATMRLVVDPEKWVVTRIETNEEGLGIVSSVQSLDGFVEAKAGIWFATTRRTESVLSDGTKVEESLVLERLKFDQTIDDSRFSFEVPKGARRIPLAQVEGPGERK